ncbi:MAG: META domain-containing protein [Acetobacteraceae bacterium]|nr:META domain-containing protein [Pseudomonadota bacterium]
MAGLKRLAAAGLVLAVAAHAADAPAPVPPALMGTWRWVETVSSAETLRVDAPERYELSFPEPGRIALRADCNRAAGGVTFGQAGAIKVGVMAMTRAMCPEGSLSDRFAQDVGRAVHWSVQDGALKLDLPADAGTLRFVKAQ